MTKVINLLGGPGVGKSSISALIYGKLKLKGYNVELVREMVKPWVYEGRTPNFYDQAYLFGVQAREEYRLYDKVDYVITDSPLILSPIYEHFYKSESIMEPAAINFLTKAKNRGIMHVNYLLTRKGGYEEDGRYQTEDEAKVVDEMIRDFLTKYGYDYTIVDSDIEDRVDDIIGDFLDE